MFLTIDRGVVCRVSETTGIPRKKIYDFLFYLKTGDAVDNNELLRRVGVSRKALNTIKKQLSFILEPSSALTRLRKPFVEKVVGLLGDDYRNEETIWTFLEDEDYERTVGLLGRYSKLRPIPQRNYDQFSATDETSARRASLMNFFDDLRGKRLLFLGDDDLTSVAVASYRTALKVSVLDIDGRILRTIKLISKKESLGINLVRHDLREPFSGRLGKFDVVFTDPPYTPAGIKLFVSRAVQALDLTNKTAKAYVCYGNSDLAKERYLAIYKVFCDHGLMVRWVFDKFSRYQGAESIGNASSLFACETTPKIKPLIKGKYEENIYTV